MPVLYFVNESNESVTATVECIFPVRIDKTYETKWGVEATASQNPGVSLGYEQSTTKHVKQDPHGEGIKKTKDILPKDSFIFCMETTRLNVTVQVGGENNPIVQTEVVSSVFFFVGTKGTEKYRLCSTENLCYSDRFYLLHYATGKFATRAVPRGNSYPAACLGPQTTKFQFDLAGSSGSARVVSVANASAVRIKSNEDIVNKYMAVPTSLREVLLPSNKVGFVEARRDDDRQKWKVAKATDKIEVSKGDVLRNGDAVYITNCGLGGIQYLCKKRGNENLRCRKSGNLSTVDCVWVLVKVDSQLHPSIVADGPAKPLEWEDSGDEEIGEEADENSAQTETGTETE